MQEYNYNDVFHVLEQKERERKQIARRGEGATTHITRAFVGKRHR